jgi:hypothetical protein
MRIVGATDPKAELAASPEDSPGLDFRAFVSCEAPGRLPSTRGLDVSRLLNADGGLPAF